MQKTEEDSSFDLLETEEENPEQLFKDDDDDDDDTTPDEIGGEDDDDDGVVDHDHGVPIEDSDEGGDADFDVIQEPDDEGGDADFDVIQDPDDEGGDAEFDVIQDPDDEGGDAEFDVIQDPDDEGGDAEIDVIQDPDDEGGDAEFDVIQDPDDEGGDAEFIEERRDQSNVEEEIEDTLGDDAELEADALDEEDEMAEREPKVTTEEAELLRRDETDTVSSPSSPSSPKLADSAEVLPNVIISKDNDSTSTKDQLTSTKTRVPKLNTLETKCRAESRSEEPSPFEQQVQQPSPPAEGSSKAASSSPLIKLGSSEMGLDQQLRSIGPLQQTTTTMTNTASGLGSTTTAVATVVNVGQFTLYLQQLQNRYAGKAETGETKGDTAPIKSDLLELLDLANMFVKYIVNLSENAEKQDELIEKYQKFKQDADLEIDELQNKLKAKDIEYKERLNQLYDELDAAEQNANAPLPTSRPRSARSEKEDDSETEDLRSQQVGNYQDLQKLENERNYLLNEVAALSARLQSAENESEISRYEKLVRKIQREAEELKRDNTELKSRESELSVRLAEAEEKIQGLLDSLDEAHGREKELMSHIMASEKTGREGGEVALDDLNYTENLNKQSSSNGFCVRESLCVSPGEVCAEIRHERLLEATDPMIAATFEARKRLLELTDLASEVKRKALSLGKEGGSSMVDVPKQAKELGEWAGLVSIESAKRVSELDEILEIASTSGGRRDGIGKSEVLIEIPAEKRDLDVTAVSQLVGIEEEKTKPGVAAAQIVDLEFCSDSGIRGEPQLEETLITTPEFLETEDEEKSIEVSTPVVPSPPAPSCVSYTPQSIVGDKGKRSRIGMGSEQQHVDLNAVLSAIGVCPIVDGDIESEGSSTDNNSRHPQIHVHFHHHGHDHTHMHTHQHDHFHEYGVTATTLTLQTSGKQREQMTEKAIKKSLKSKPEDTTKHQMEKFATDFSTTKMKTNNQQQPSQIIPPPAAAVSVTRKVKSSMKQKKTQPDEFETFVSEARLIH